MDKLIDLLHKNPRKVLIVGVILVLLLGNRYQSWQQQNIIIPAEKEASATTSVSEIVEEEYIYVHVTGAVENPGVYALEKGKRIEDAILQAGLSTDADIEVLNRAALVSDGQKIVVPSIIDDTNFEEVLDDGKVSINQGSLQELISLPGIGEQKGQAIIDYRSEYGGFSSLEDLCNVPGIGQATYKKLLTKIKL